MSVAPARSAPTLGVGDHVKPKEQPPKVPNMWDAMTKDLATARWLGIRDGEEDGAMEQMQGENVNLALICALLLTVFAPLYYTEAAKINIPDEGFMLDMFNGWLNRTGRLHLPKYVVHEFFDIGYFYSVTFSVIGTFTSVYFAMAANESGTDANVLVLRKRIGGLMILPYICFSVAVLGFCTPFWLHFLVVTRTLLGLFLKLVPGVSIVAVFMWCNGKMVQGLFLGRQQELTILPSTLEEDRIKELLSDFFAQSDISELNVKAFLTYLRGEANDVGYKPPLSYVTRIRATKMFVEKMSKMLNISAKELRQLDALSSANS